MQALNDGIMKSKKQRAKEAQGYDSRPAFPMCSNCAHFQFDLVKRNGYFNDYVREENLRCGAEGSGNFAVKKTATCKFHQFSNESGNVPSKGND